jgi:hypothetical protein
VVTGGFLIEPPPGEQEKTALATPGRTRYASRTSLPVFAEA